MSHVYSHREPYNRRSVPLARLAIANMSAEVITILIVDDHPVVRLGLKTMLATEDGLRVVGMAGSGKEALAEFQRSRPDVVLMDLRMPEMEGTDVITELRRLEPDLRILVLTNYGSDQYIIRALQAGAMGYLLKSTPQDEIVQAVRDVHHNKRCIPEHIAQRLFQAIGRKELSPRELEVLALVAKGNTNKEVAQQLFISELTARNHVTSFLLKLSANDRTEAVTTAIERGLIRVHE
jgi:DNA-binding NarL/FixJ family response regulator